MSYMQGTEEQASGKRSDHPKTERIAAHIKFLSSGEPCDHRHLNVASPPPPSFSLFLSILSFRNKTEAISFD